MVQDDKIWFLTIKDVMCICGCSHKTACYLRKDIADFFGIKTRFVTYGHLKTYLKL